MKIGIVKEIKNNEKRVALPPASVYELVQAGHEVYVETLAGEGSAISDEAYLAVGAIIKEKAADVTSEEAILSLRKALSQIEQQRSHHKK